MPEELFACVVIAATVGAMLWPSPPKQDKRINPKRPVPETYRLKFTETYGSVKKTLLHMYDPPVCWRVKDEDRARGELRAFIELPFIVDDENGRTKEVRCGMTLDVAISTQPDGATDVVLNFRGEGANAQQQESLESAMRETNAAVHAALDQLEVARHG